jgi:hypothetical protein
MPLKIFISHSSEDAKIAKALINLFQKSLNIPSSNIRCTSVDGYKLPVGSSTISTLKSEVEESEVFIGILTNISIQSTYVLFEMGARWGSGKPLLPVLAAGATPSILQAPLNDYNALDCNNESHIHQMLENLSDLLKMRLERPNVYADLVDDVVRESTSRGEANVDFNIILNSSLVGRASAFDRPPAASILLGCSIVNLSNRHVIVDHYDLIVNFGDRTFKFGPAPISEETRFSAENRPINTKSAEAYDITKRSDSIAPGQGISGLLLFIGEADFYQIMTDSKPKSVGELTNHLSMEVVGIDGKRYQAKVLAADNNSISIFSKIGFSTEGL